MLKDHRVIVEVGKVIKQSTKTVIEKVFSLHDEVRGREEEITSQIRSEINLHLIEEIERRLHGKKVKDIRFEVYIYKKKSEEPLTGADLAGIVEQNINGNSITKAFLAQAKVGKIVKNKFNDEYIESNDARTLKQVQDMLRITSSSFVFLYSKKGIDVISGHAIQLANSNKVTTERFYTRQLGSFYEEILKCFIGDHKITPYPLSNLNLDYFANQVNAQNVFMIKGSTESNNKQLSRFANVEI